MKIYRPTATTTKQTVQPMMCDDRSQKTLSTPYITHNHCKHVGVTTHNPPQ